MSIGSRIKEARISSSLTQEAVAKKIGVTKAAVANYENGVSIPKPEVLYKLMEVFELDANYFYQDMISLKTSFIPSAREEKFLQQYRSLDDHGKKAVDSVLEVEASRCDSETAESPAYIHRQYYSQRASAGTGQILFDDLHSSEIMLPDTPLNRKADYVISVKGSSMEPTYHDGDRLLVKRQDSVRIGEIGIFVLNGETFVKELGEHALLSHNKQYQDIPLDEFDNIQCEGKVIGAL